MIAKKKAPKKSAKEDQERLRIWLMYPPKHITSPIVWELITRFELKANIRQAEVRDEIGIVCPELKVRAHPSRKPLDGLIAKVLKLSRWR